jgi:hypothetical protein
LYVSSVTRFVSICSLLLLFVTSVAAEPPSEEIKKTFPSRVGDFLSQGIHPLSSLAQDITLSDYADLRGFAEGSYLSLRSGQKLTVEIVRARTDSDAYAMLTSVSHRMRVNDASETKRLEDVGTAGVASPGHVAFFKGTTFVRITSANKEAGGIEESLALARLFAETIDKGEGDIPVLVKHLPDWEMAQENATYATRLHTLQEAIANQPVLDAINFEGGTEAVTANYGASRLVLVEYTTPQIATESDTRINARIKDLRDAGQPSPSAYRRVGNYSVFVFDAPDEAAAAQLIDKVSYEQVVQWLGNNPRALERAQKIYTQTTAGIILAVIKASGLSLLLCLGIGSIFGTLIFRRRRAQQAATDAYSDAGGMVRLNIDEMTAQSDPARLLGRGNG